MADNYQNQINDLIKDSPQESDFIEDEFLKEENQPINEPASPGRIDKDHEFKEPEGSKSQQGKIAEDKSLYEKMEDGELDLKNIIDDSPADINSSDRIKPVSEEKEEALKEKVKEIELGDKEEEIKSKAASLGLGYINLKGLPIMPEALRLIPEEESRKKGIICFLYKKDKEIRLAILENNNKIKELTKKISEEHPDIIIQIYLTSQMSMQEALKTYASLPKIRKKTDEVEILEADLEKSAKELVNLKDLEKKLKSASITQILSLILAAAVKVSSSDIHIEAEELGIQVRFRVDGVLHDVAKLDREEWEKLMSRIKLSSGLKINVKDKPQDGHFSIHIKDKPVDFRVSTLPTTYGESVVMRILYHEKIKGMTLDNLGIEDYNRQILDKEIQKPNGMIVVTGPTGAGKTTTLYAILNKLNQPSNKIITIEDPVEYKIEGINQSEVKPDKGYTFDKALRSVVRQDPDIILVGEIRDKQTTEICLNAALTGHLVFTTLHTNDAAGTILRLLSLGAKPYLLAPAINVAVAQRLVRKICNKCKEEVKINESDKERARQVLESLPDKHKIKFDLDINNLKVYKGKGCEECAGLGYKGQIGIFEVFQINDVIRDMIMGDKLSEHKLKEAAQKEGMITMLQDGLMKVIKGVTSLEEVFRVG